MTPDFDHLALATRDVGAALAQLVGELGGIVTAGGDGFGFRWVQTRLGDAARGLTVEVLTPWKPEANDFLERFLDRRGDGPHHLTFKVSDLAAMLARVRAAGFTPVGVDTSNPEWKEAFLHPREAHGVVVQLAESHEPFGDRGAELEHVAQHGPWASPRWWPEPGARADARRVAAHVVLRTPDGAAARALFAGLLGGTVDTVDGPAAELLWPGGSRLRIEETRDAAGVCAVALDDGPGADAVVAGIPFAAQDVRL